jgi:hypothetical protein
MEWQPFGVMLKATGTSNGAALQKARQQRIESHGGHLEQTILGK